MKEKEKNMEEAFFRNCLAADSLSNAGAGLNPSACGPYLLYLWVQALTCL
jgi:hypothetical protein